ncbi:hypothetical protein PVK06_028286 [Gossypium arboreum]|uniref:Uncharacterized protein n=1 Tax=Gossypium arboreum TaxID=29729 RepID=A0ABR0P2P2_GOSAR|nr:hypothetical protein PVK06_028286 [Gossypium arboreum]
MPPAPRKKPMRKRVDQDRLVASEGIEGQQWPEDMSDSSMGGVSEEEKGIEEEEDDKVMKDNTLEPFHDDFKEAFMPTHASTIGFVIQDPSDRLNYHNSM